MKRNSFLIILVCLLLLTLPVFSQGNYECLFGKGRTKTAAKNPECYGSLIHQHQEFFNKTFSLTGVETGILLNQNLLVGAYGSTFVSGLEVERSDNFTHFMISQTGIVIGFVSHPSSRIHMGSLVSIGYASIRGDRSPLSVFNAEKAEIRVHGSVVTPQVFGEVNLMEWLKFRTGLGYSFYSFQQQPTVRRADLQKVSFNFGFLFGKFS
jgi:hypothetical protein